MKKWLISFLLLISIFIGYNKVGASSVIDNLEVDYDGEYIDYFEINDSKINYIKEMITYLDNNLSSNYDYVIYIGYDKKLHIYVLNNIESFNDGSWLWSSYNFGSGYTYNLNLSYTRYLTNVINNKYFGLYTYATVDGTTIPYTFSNVICEFDSIESCKSSFNNLTFTNVNNDYASIATQLGMYTGSYFNNSSHIRKFYSVCDFSTSCPDSYYYFNMKVIMYSSKPLLISTYTNSSNYVSLTFTGNDKSYSISNSLGYFQTYFDIYDINDVVLNSVKDFGNNTYGFYQNVIGLNATSLSGAVDTLSIICEEDKPFENGFCSMNYNDLIKKNSNISFFNNYGLDFTQLFGNNVGFLHNDKYYLYSFRIQKPFVPQVGNIFINSLTNNSNQVNILDVYLNDGGSYTDYVVKFKIENSNYDSTTNLKDILVVFRDGLGTYYNNFIPNTFNYSVYRSFKLQYFDSEPTMSNVNDFYNNNDLSYIDGVSSQNSFFTDNEFNSFGFGGIITAPFRFLYALENYDSCSDITLPFPHSNQNLTLTCVRKNIPDSLNPLIVILQVVLSGIISYRIAVGTLKIIKDVSSPEDSNIEVVDL